MVDAKWLSADGRSSVVGSDPGWQELLRWQKELVDWYGYDNLEKFRASLGQEFSADNAFHKGQLAMNFDGEYRIAFLKAQTPGLEYGTAPFPVPDGLQDRYGAAYVTGNIMGISKGAKNPEAAWALIKYLTLDTGAMVKLANGLKNVPTTTDALKSPDLQLEPEFKTFVDIFNNPKSSTTPPSPAGPAYQETFQQFVNSYQAGKVKDLDSGLKSADQQINSVMTLGG
jgi:multiple sugar transport system substrate-binding protein